MQKLDIFQSLWAMELRSPHLAERTHEESFRMVSDAGYDGMCIDPGAGEIDRFRELLPLYDKFGLGCMVNAFPSRLDDMHPLLTMANEFNDLTEKEAQVILNKGTEMPFSGEYD